MADRRERLPTAGEILFSRRVRELNESRGFGVANMELRGLAGKTREEQDAYWGKYHNLADRLMTYGVLSFDDLHELHGNLREGLTLDEANQSVFTANIRAEGQKLDPRECLVQELQGKISFTPRPQVDKGPL